MPTLQFFSFVPKTKVGILTERLHEINLHFNVMLSWFTGDAQDFPFCVWKGKEHLLFFIFQPSHSWSYRSVPLSEFTFFIGKAKWICWKLDFKNNSNDHTKGWLRFFFFSLTKFRNWKSIIFFLTIFSLFSF